MKTCKDCQNEKEVTEFYKNQNDCKECFKAKVKENRRKNKKYYLEYDKQRANREDRVKARTEYSKTEKGKEAHKKAREKWKSRNSFKNSAINQFNNWIRYNKDAKKTECENCGDSKKRIEAHHDDYSKPLRVRWLCNQCHNDWHKHNEPKVPF